MPTTALAAALQRIGQREASRLAKDWDPSKHPHGEHGWWARTGMNGPHDTSISGGGEGGGGGRSNQFTPIANKPWEDLAEHEKETRLAEAFLTVQNTSKNNPDVGTRKAAEDKLAQWNKLLLRPADRAALMSSIGAWHDRRRERVVQQRREDEEKRRIEAARLQEEHQRRQYFQSFKDIDATDREETQAALNAAMRHREEKEKQAFQAELGNRTTGDKSTTGRITSLAGRITRAGYYASRIARSMGSAIDNKSNFAELGRHLTHMRDDLRSLKEELSHIPREAMAAGSSLWNRVQAAQDAVSSASAALRGAKKS